MTFLSTFSKHCAILQITLTLWTNMREWREGERVREKETCEYCD